MVSAQVMISPLLNSSPRLGSALSARDSLFLGFSLSTSLSAPPLLELVHARALSLKINKHTKKKVMSLGYVLPCFNGMDLTASF